MASASVPKPAGVRARRNRSATAATLRPVANPTVPRLPGEGWHERTVEWWADLWRSPMAPEYDDTDRHGLYVMALLLDQVWTCESVRGKTDTAAEVRQWVAEYGLSPIARRRLQWEIDRGDEAAERTDKRRSARQSSGRRSPDPRRALGA